MNSAPANLADDDVPAEPDDTPRDEPAPETAAPSDSDPRDDSATAEPRPDPVADQDAASPGTEASDDGSEDRPARPPRPLADGETADLFADEPEPEHEPDHDLHLRMLEALLFAAAEPLDDDTLTSRLPKDAQLPMLLDRLTALYETRGVNLVRVAGKWAFRTATDLAFMLRKETTEQKRLSRAGIETLAIVAYHQPVTRAEIEEIRGVGVSKGTLDLLIEIGWVRPRGRRRTPGKPVTYGTTDAFLEHFGMDRVGDLPGMEELKLAGLLDSSVPAGFSVPSPSDALAPDEDPLDEADMAELMAPKMDDD